MENINALREDVAALRSEVRLQKSLGCSRLSTPSPVKFCMLYMRVFKGLDDASIGKVQLEALLKCQVVHYMCVKTLPCPVFRVKIFEEALQRAIVAGRESGCFVDLWRRPKETVASHSGGGVCSGEGKSTQSRTECHTLGLNVTCWNCRGFQVVVPTWRP